MGFDWWLHIMTFSGLNQFWSSTTFWQNIPIHKKNLSKFCNIILCPHRLLKSLSFLVVPSNNLGWFLNAGGTRLLPSGSLSMKSIPLHAIVRKNARFSTWRCRCRHIQLQDGREGVGKGGQAACYCPCCAACGRSGMHGTCVTLPPCPPPPPIPVLHKLRKKASNMKANMQIQHLTYILTIFLACRQQDDQATIPDPVKMKNVNKAIKYALKRKSCISDRFQCHTATITESILFWQCLEVFACFKILISQKYFHCIWSHLWSR